MPNLNKQRIGESLIYFLVWLSVALMPILSNFMLGDMRVDMGNVLISWRKLAPYFLLFFVNNAILAPHLMLKRRYVAYIIWTIVVLVIIFGIVDAYERYLLRDVPDLETMVEMRRASFTDLAFQWNILLGMFMVSANSLIKLLYHNMLREKQYQELVSHNLQSEIDYLKYQINPHFFMNTLNNIHALIDIDAECAKGTLIELSRMMRYVLYESGANTTTLAREMAFVENYVELMRIRYSDDLDIKIRYPQNQVEQVCIPPLLIIVFVENAFKHGISLKHHSCIYIDVEIEHKESICFKIRNSKHTSVTPHKPGIGLENVTKRLQLIYGDRYNLDIDDADNEYVVKLTIPYKYD